MYISAEVIINYTLEVYKCKKRYKYFCNSCFFFSLTEDERAGTSSFVILSGQMFGVVNANAPQMHARTHKSFCDIF